MIWDTIVIGSGPGGLTAAVALARAGQRVLVLEQHYLPGGWTHSFTLGGHRFSPGVHYIGNLHPGGGLRKVYESFGMSESLEFCELRPDGFDHLLIAGQRFDQPKGREAWIARLKAAFPHEAECIDRFFDLITGLNEDVCKCDTALEFPAVLALPFRVPRLARWGFRTLQALLDHTVHDPMLKAVLSAQCGNHGLPPSRVSLPLHASMTTHYFDGAYYPRGGAKRIPAAYISALRRHGGKIRLGTAVERILVEDDRIVGVRIAGGEELRAGQVVCNADPAVTYGSLLPPKYCASQIRKLKKTEYSVGMMSLFLAVKNLDLRAMGFDSGNYWYYAHPDVGGIYEKTARELPRGDVEGLFLTITSLKDPPARRSDTHTIEMFTFVPYDAFAPWSNTTMDTRPADYNALKENLAAKMLITAERVIPKLRAHLSFLSVGSPLTNDFYCGSYRGAIYGTAKTPFQVGPFSFSSRGPVRGLYFAGASIISHGVAGATMSGLIAAQQVLGASSSAELIGPGDGSLRIYPADAPDTWVDRAVLSDAA